MFSGHANANALQCFDAFTLYKLATHQLIHTFAVNASFHYLSFGRRYVSVTLTGRKLNAKRAAQIGDILRPLHSLRTNVQLILPKYLLASLSAQFYLTTNYFHQIPVLNILDNFTIYLSCIRINTAYFKYTWADCQSYKEYWMVFFLVVNITTTIILSRIILRF